jgi:putative intracellular protease/amidase
MRKPHILVVLTSHDTLGRTGEKTGFWLEEFASPYYVFKDAGAAITLASIKGGQPPIDPKSSLPEWQTDATRRFNADREGLAALAATGKVADLDASGYDMIFFPGGHGPMWDYPGNEALAHLIEAFDEEEKIVAAVCHGPVALVSAKRADGKPLVAGRKVSAFTNGEEAAVGLTDVVPFLLEDRLRDLGAVIQNGADFTVNVVADGNLVTGQNPQSSEEAAHVVLRLFAEGHRAKAA